MRVYGRIVPDVLYPDRLKWVIVKTDEQGYNDDVYVTNLIQVLKLNLGESPFWANYGIPAKNSVQQQIAPDFYASRTQSYFAQFFASLIILAQPSRGNPNNPIYKVEVITNVGSKISAQIAT